MNIRLNKLSIENFRGIKKAEAIFGESNFLVGDNGTGKTTTLAAISRLMPALRNEKRIFLDADFCFISMANAEKIKLAYEIDITFENEPKQSITMELIGERQNTGVSRSHLNDQIEATTTIQFPNQDNIEILINRLNEQGILRQRIIRNGWGGGRIAPISLESEGRQKHAATSEKEESGNFDGLRARLVQLLKKSDIGEAVNDDHPDLLSNTLKFTNEFLGENRFSDILLGHSDQLTLQRSEGVIQPWEGLSGGEQSAFNLSMAIEFEKKQTSQILIIEEPENNIHPAIQRDFIKIIQRYLPGRQIFIATHSPYLFENHLHDSNLIITKKHDSILTITSSTNNFGLFSQISWGELSYYAYNLPTFEFHNELYGWIQEQTSSMTEREMENYLTTQHNLQKDKEWIRSNRNNQPQNPYDVTIMTYIRNFTHHPENTHNQDYTNDQLSNSINKMIGIVNTII